MTGANLDGQDLPTPNVGGRRSRRTYALGLFALLLAVYMSNGYTAGNNDATANVRLPLQVLDHGRLTFTPEDSPFMFTWRLTLPERDVPARFHSWNEVAAGRTPRLLQQSGALRDPWPKYYLVETREPGVYANTFGLGAGLLALPALAVVRPFASSFDQDATLLWQVGKLVAAVAVALSAVFLFLAALAHLSPRAAFALALLYGLGTCAWSVSSQNLLQHAPAELFLAMGTYFWLKQTPRSIFLAGLACSGAVACRPTCLLVIAVLAVWLGGDRVRSLLALPAAKLRARPSAASGGQGGGEGPRVWEPSQGSHQNRNRPHLLRFCLGALPVGLLLVLYGWLTFGDPLAAGQLLVGPRVALTKTGNPSLYLRFDVGDQA